MVILKDNYPRFTPEEYFAWEEQQLERHELIDGQAYAMSGGTINHGRIGIKVTAMLDSHLDNSPCRVGDTVEFRSINLSFPIEQVYRGIVFE